MVNDSTRKPTQLVLLDRDGVINYDSPDYIKSADEWQPIPGALAAIGRLNDAGIDTALCSNQAGISRGLMSARDLAAIHDRFCRELAQAGGYISLWRFCPHHPDDNCACRKPNTGMLDDCMTELGVAGNAVTFVGDSLKDMQAALQADCQAVLVTGAGHSDPSLKDAAQNIGVRHIADDLSAAADFILQQSAN